MVERESQQSARHLPGRYDQLAGMRRPHDVEVMEL